MYEAGYDRSPELRLPLEKLDSKVCQKSDVKLFTCSSCAEVTVFQVFDYQLYDLPKLSS